MGYRSIARGHWRIVIQAFARDVGFVIDDKIIVSNIIPNREDEKEAYEVVYNQIAYNKIFNLPEKGARRGR